MASPYEIARTSQIVDVRPWADRAAEALADPVNMAFAAGMVIVFTLAMPALLVVTLPMLLTMFIAARKVGKDLPLRYPPSVRDPIKNEMGNGILFLGNMDYDKDKKNRLPLESLADKFKECWLADDDLRKHLLVLGSTGSGKSELLKGIFFNALCWGSGFFVADGKADNKLFLDIYNMARWFGRDDDLLALNFLLARSTPEQVRTARRRRTNKTNPFSTADADTIVQMGANLLPKVDGDAKNWQEKALNCWRGLVPALCWLRDHEGLEISVRTFVDSLALVELEKLYAKGYVLAQRNGGVWPDAFEGIKAYLEGGLPGFKLERALKKHGAMPKAPASGGKPEPLDQDATAYDQHGYRATQLNPALNLLDKTYGHIFTDKFSEIDMVDVTLNNRILGLMIPSLEKSAQEAESLGKLTVACLRVMMGKNLGAEIEGTRRQISESKATEANYPYVVALDELGYYFSDGIAVMFAQARSLGFSMIAAAQDIEKLTEGTRAAEAGAMLANQVVKVFMRIDDANKTNEMIQKYLGKANVALRTVYEHESGFGFRKLLEVKVEEIPRATLENLQKLPTGKAVLNTSGDTFKVKGFYVGDLLKKHPTDEFHINRFLQVRGYTASEIERMSVPIDMRNDPAVKGQRLKDLLTGDAPAVDVDAHARRQSYADRYEKARAMVKAVARASEQMPGSKKGADRAAALFLAAEQFLRQAAHDGADVAVRRSSGGEKDASASHQRAVPLSVGQGDPGVDISAAALARSPVVMAMPVGDRIEQGAGTGLSGRMDAAFVDNDPFAFLNAHAPLQRKPVAEVLQRQSSASEKACADQTLKSILSGDDAQARPDEAGEQLSSAPPAVRTRTIEAMPGYLQEELSAVLARSGNVQLGALLDQVERNGVSDAAPPAAAQWVSKALEGAFAAKAALAAGGVTVVGLTPPSQQALMNFERAMGSQDPSGAVAAVEQIVASQTTPEPAPSGALQADDVDQLMNLIDGLK